jgi:PEGA domain-containing protein
MLKAADPPVSAAAHSGGFRVTAPVEVHVLDGERLLGSSVDGPIIAPAGQHEFEFVNSAIGYRVRRVVDVKPGQITAVTVNVPNGTLNINATPWATVWIDGAAYGDTPLGNVSIAPGEHEVVLRHPQFGERREKAIVRADGATRVSVVFR